MASGGASGRALTTGRDAGTPLPPELEVLSPGERAAFRLVRTMNQGAWKHLWGLAGRTIGAGWIHLVTCNLERVYGLEHLEAVSRERPLVLVANHRTFWDLYVTTSVLFRRTRGWREIYFPVRGRFFYQSAGGVLLNALAAWWSMYPPFFHQPSKRRFDQYSLRLLMELCREGHGRLIGFHPEGTRNKGVDPYCFLPAQPGIGRIIKEANPQVMPVFLAGLGHSFGRQILANWTRGEPIRVRFGPMLDYSAFLSGPDTGATYRAIADHVMGAIRALGEADRRQFHQR